MKLRVHCRWHWLQLQPRCGMRSGHQWPKSPPPPQPAHPLPSASPGGIPLTHCHTLHPQNVGEVQRHDCSRPTMMDTSAPLQSWMCHACMPGILGHQLCPGSCTTGMSVSSFLWRAAVERGAAASCQQDFQPSGRGRLGVAIYLEPSCPS